MPGRGTTAASRTPKRTAPLGAGKGKVMTTFYLICFTLGLSLTVLSALGAFTHLHIGHVHLHLHPGHGAGHTHVHISGSQAAGKASVSPVNGFTLAAFLCWFGGCGYLLARSHDFGMWVVLSLATSHRHCRRRAALLVPGQGAAAA